MNRMPSLREWVAEDNGRDHRRVLPMVVDNSIKTLSKIKTKNTMDLTA